ncbi:MAG: aminotransferase class I/II-fold pyridoxal phosphate-dependent enzyme [Kangiellaceae bacterium]|nr:aminotransferase class I/II-fold pyridoxal phosphate-dependent enzyme [Kangiellaceae bacterium]
MNSKIRQTATKSGILKLDFNERSDKNSSVESDLSYEQNLWSYPNRQELESILAKQFDVKSEQVLCTNGGDEAIYILMRLMSESGRVILPLPAFSQYLWGIKSWKLDASLIESKDDLSIDLEATIAEIKRQKDSVTIITRPNNPTGELIAEDSLQRIIETAEKNDSWVFLDEAYIEFCEHDCISSSLLQKHSNLVILRTLSKAYGLAGIRFGYLLGTTDKISVFGERCMPFNISSPSLSIAKRALEEENQCEVKDYCERIIQNRNIIANMLSNAGIKFFQGQANFVFLKLPTGLAKAITSYAEKNDILLKSFVEKELSECLRIGIPYEIERLKDFLKNVFSPKLVCLDMDGVLIDTSGSYDEAVKQTVFKLSNQIIEQQQITELRRSGGYNNDWVVSQKLLDILGMTVDLEAVTQEFQAIYLGENGEGLVNNETSLINPSLVKKITVSNSQTFCIVTGRPRKEAQSGQKLIGLEPLELISLDDVDEPKPSPEGIKKMQNQILQNNPALSFCTWMCGDNPDDMQAAVGSNSMAIGIGLDNQDALYAAGADIVIASINEIEEWLV